jgi:CRP-like cAMP-binding protein
MTMSHADRLRNLIPVNSLAEDNFNELAASALVQSVPAGTVLFKEGDTDHQSVYLLEGEVRLASTRTEIARTLQGDSDDARYALAQLKPRQVTGTATKDSVVARVDSDLLDRLLTWDQVSGIEVVEMDGDEDTDWMLTVLRSPTFEKLPAVNANEMFSRMETVPVKAHDVVVRQGDTGDYYYLIREGKCAVSQKDAAGKVGIVNQLGPGDQFGEEALLSDAPRNATIMMTTDGVLMRLAKKDFLQLLKVPLIDWIEQKQAEAMLARGAGLLDVRTSEEFARGAIRSARNVPLYQIRKVVPELEPDKKYVVYCQTGSRSAIATFMLNQRGFDTYALKGGLSGLQTASEVGGNS